MNAVSTVPLSAAHTIGAGKTLAQGADGIWYANERETISYLQEGNEVCFELEEKSFWFAHRNACLCALVRRFPPAGTIFDIGGGNGVVSRTLLDAGFDCVLVEPGRSGARNAMRRGIPMVICATFKTAGFAAGELPAVGLFDVLEHIEDDRAFLRELHEAMRGKGRLYLTVPAGYWLWSDDDVVAGHFRRYGVALLKERLHEAGFRVLYASRFFSILPLPLFVARVLPSLFGHRRLPREEYGRLHDRRARKMTDRIWAAEIGRIQRGAVIPFGSSCLVAAEKR
jgi:SAM-dependent methyltransferase